MKKKLFALLLAVVMILAVSIPMVSATEAALDTTQKISFSAVCNKAGYEFSVYKVADLVKTSASPYGVKYQNSISNTALQTAIDAGSDASQWNNGATNTTDTSTNLASDAILTVLDGLTAAQLGAPVGTYTVDTDGSSKTFSNLNQGIYYVRATNFPAGVKAVTNSVFALPYYTTENGWVYTIPSIPLATKVDESVPEIVKTITNSTKNNVNYTDVSLGDTVNFEIQTDTVGKTNSVATHDFKLNSYVITDVMSKGLTLNQNSFVVKLLNEAGTATATLAKDTDYKVNITATAGQDTTFTVNLTSAYLQKEAFYGAKKVSVTYTADLNKYAVTGTAGNPNEAVSLTYSNKNDVSDTVEGNTVYVYTYTIQVQKFDDLGTKLSGADFSLYASAADAAANENVLATGTSDTNGLVEFKNASNEVIRLQSGTYYVKETKAPTGYNRFTDTITVPITATYGNTFTNNTYVTSAPENGIASIQVKNSKTVLPQTGGVGDIPLYIGASILALFGMSLIFVTVKKSRREKAD